MAKGLRDYLAEAMQCIRETDDPVAALRLLLAMRGGAYASRNNQLSALEAVGHWLEQRLQREPKAPAERIACELGWLRRLAPYFARAQPGRATSSPDSSRGNRRQKSDSVSRFGRFIDEIARRRHHEDSQPVANPEAKVATAPAGPDRLPEEFAAELGDFEQACEARRNARKREKHKKPPKDRLLPIRPEDPLLRPLAANLCCSLLGTEGMNELFELIEKRGGRPQSFWIRLEDLEDKDEMRMAKQICLSAPSTADS